MTRRRTERAARRAAQLAALLAALAALAWPAIYNGQPVFFGDTSAYLRGADAGVQALFHRRSAWSLEGGNAIAKSGDAPPPRTRSAAHGNSIAHKSILYGRSPYYGALLYLGDLTGGFWLTVALQAVAVLGALAIALSALGAPLWPLLAILGGLAGLTTAPFFVSFLMPDIFAGIAIVTAAALLAAHARLSLGQAAAACALLGVSVIAHESHALIVGVLFVAAVAYALLRRSVPNRRGLAAVGLALCIAVLAQVGFRVAVKRVVGAAPVRPPFLMARMIEDGPGYRYLRETCPGNGLEVCKYLGRLPMPANLFLWDTGPRGIFGSASPSARRALAADQMRFVWGVLSHDPRGELHAVLRDVQGLLEATRLEEFEYDAGEKQTFAAKFPRGYLETLERTPAYRGTLPTALWSSLSLALSAAGAALIIAVLAWGGLRSQLPRPLVELSAWILIGVAVNLLVCGILSGPHARYATRVTWLLPLDALLIALALARAGVRGRRASVPPAGAVGSA